MTSFSRALLVAITLLAAASCMAQSITGVVYDQDGAVVPNARVFLMEDYVKQQETRSGEAGNFTFRGLRPGMYQVQVKQERLSLAQQTVTLKANEEARVYVVLSLAHMTDSVQVGAQLGSSVRRAERSTGQAHRTGGSGGKVEPARLLVPLRPIYPVGAAARGVDGTVVIYAKIRADGSLSDSIVLVSPDTELEREALRAAANLRYQPMKLNDHPVDCRVIISVEFRLQ